MSDNKKLIMDCMTFEVSPEQLNESIKENNGKLIVSGVLQVQVCVRDGQRIDDGYNCWGTRANVCIHTLNISNSTV